MVSVPPLVCCHLALRNPSYSGRGYDYLSQSTVSNQLHTSGQQARTAVMLQQQLQLTGLVPPPAVRSMVTLPCPAQNIA